MRKILTFILTAALCAAFAMPALAADYDFGSGPDTGETFGKPTSYDAEVTPDPMTQNIRRNKDAADFPPAYGVFSGDIPTDPTSLYHDNTSPYAGYTGNPSATLDTSFASGVSDTGVSNVGVSGAGDSGYGGMLPSTSTYETPVYNTAPKFYNDGSIGTLHIPSANKTITVYEGESLESMKKGIGHFESTSCWDGNVALAGHNRGAAAYFRFVKKLETGDTLTYTTQYGERTYTVYNKVKISETDYSGLAWSDENIVSLITCVENEPAYRWLVQARENG